MKQANLTLPTEDIRVEEGFNARTRHDEVALKRLSANVAKEGVVEPLLVRVDENGVVWLIAGHRRLAAAQNASLERVPVAYYEGERPRQVSLIENLHREDLDPIDAARGMKAIAEEFDLTKPELAEQLDMSLSWVSERLRLLDLPDGVQELIASGVVPVEAERLLRKVAAVSPRVAECICITARRKKTPKGSFVRDFDDLLRATAEGRFPEKPTMVDVRRVTVSDVIADRKERVELSERINVVDRYYSSEDPEVRFEEAEVDAARAAGCLIEHEVDQGGWLTVLAYITDAEMAADLSRRAVDRREAEAKKRAEEEVAWREQTGQTSDTPEEQKEARKAQRQQAKVDAASARSFNEKLGRNLIERRGKGTRKQHGLARAKAAVKILLADNPELAAGGLRLVLPQLQEVKVKHLKSGEPREKVSYADAEQCGAYLHNRIDEAKTEGEVYELFADAVIAALLADHAELPQSKRIRWGSRAVGEVEKLLAVDIKAVKPRAQRKR